MDPPAPADDITALLRRAGAGDAQAHHALLAAVYHELKRISRAQRRDRADPTLDTTALVHEAWLKLAGTPDLSWPDRHRFFAYAARAMRTLLVDRARGQLTAKRGAAQPRIPLDEVDPAAPDTVLDLLALHDVLEKVASIDPRIGEIVEMHVFAGLPFAEIAHGLSISERAVYRAWQKGRALIDTLLRAPD